MMHSSLLQRGVLAGLLVPSLTVCLSILLPNLSLATSFAAHIWEVRRAGTSLVVDLVRGTGNEVQLWQGLPSDLDGDLYLEFTQFERMARESKAVMIRRAEIHESSATFDLSNVRVNPDVTYHAVFRVGDKVIDAPNISDTIKRGRPYLSPGNRMMRNAGLTVVALLLVFVSLVTWGCIAIVGAVRKGIQRRTTQS